MATYDRSKNGLMNGQIKSATASVRRFLLHFLEIAVAMIAGIATFEVFSPGPSEADQILWYAGLQLSIIPPIIAVMLLQHDGWRSSLEMAGVMLIVPTIVLACAAFGWNYLIPGLSRNTVLQFADPKMMIVGLFFAMLPRRKMYTIRTIPERAA